MSLSSWEIFERNKFYKGQHCMYMHTNFGMFYVQQKISFHFTVMAHICCSTFRIHFITGHSILRTFTENRLDIHCVVSVVVGETGL